MTREPSLKPETDLHADLTAVTPLGATPGSEAQSEFSLGTEIAALFQAVWAEEVEEAEVEQPEAFELRGYEIKPAILS
jgi:hypothetical protein